MIYRFADCVLDTDCYVLYRSGDAVPLRPKVFQVLTYLLEQQPRVISKQELVEQIWPDQIVSDAAVEACIKAVRRVVGDSGRIQRVIQTRHGHGYGVTASVTRDVSASPQDLLVADAQADVVWPRPDSTCQGVTLHAGERKTVTMLCCALTASPRAEQPVELDVLYRYLNILYDMVADTTDAYGGSLQPPAGQHVLVVFGAPAAQEDHAQRAILTALALRHRWGAYQAAHGDSEANMLSIRMGVYTGTAAVGGINADNQTAMVIVGDSATFAVALQESAEPGAIRCCQTTAHAVRSVSYVKAAAPLCTMAQAGLLPTYDVLRQRLRRARGALHSAWTQRPLVGREPELNLLHRLWTQVQAGRGQVVGIVGEAGIGKSRLIHAFRHRLRGAGLTYLTGRCLSYSCTTPYLPIMDLLRHACGLTEFDAPKVVSWKVQHCLEVVGLDAARDAPYLLSLFGLQTASDDPVTPAPDAFRARTFAILLQLCLQGSLLYPLVLEIEDIHWLDATSEAWLTSLVDRLAEVPILVLTTYRFGYYPSWLAKPYATQVALGRLTLRDSQQLLRTILSPSHRDPQLIQQLIVQSDGNPLFLTELARSLTEQEPSQALRDLPDTIQAVLTTRIDRLSPAAKHVLQMASVVGKEIRWSLLLELSALPETTLRHSLIELQTTDLLYETSRSPDHAYTFAHILTQEAAYQSLLRHVRQHYHQRIAQALMKHTASGTEIQPNLLAYHYTEAGLHEDAITWWHRAGQHAMQQASYIEALSHCTTAFEMLDAVRDPAARLRFELDLSIVRSRSLMEVKGFADPEVDQAYASLQALSKRVGNPWQIAVVLKDRRTLYASRADWKRANKLGEHLYELAQRVQSPHLLSVAHHSLGMTLSFYGDVSAARMHLERSIALGQSLETQDWGDVSAGRSVIACNLWMLGYPDQALAHAKATLAQSRAKPFGVNLLFILFYVALVYQWRREWCEFYEITAESFSLASDLGLPRWFLFPTVAQGRALVARGQVDAGLRQMCRGIAAYQDVGGKLSFPLALALLAEAYGETGQPENGLQILSQALDMVQKSGDSWYAAELHRLYGELLLRRACPEEAWERAESGFQQALGIAARQQTRSLELRAAMSLSRLWHQQGKTHAAQQLLAPVIDGFTEGFDTKDLRDAMDLLKMLETS